MWLNPGNMWLHHSYMWLHLIICGCTLVICGWSPVICGCTMVICGCTWLYAVAPFLTHLKHRIPLATVFTTLFIMCQQKREMCTEVACKVCYVVPVGIYVCSRHYGSTVWNRVFLQDVVVSAVGSRSSEGVQNLKMKGIVTRVTPWILTTRTT